MQIRSKRRGYSKFAVGLLAIATTASVVILPSYSGAPGVVETSSRAELSQPAGLVSAALSADEAGLSFDSGRGGVPQPVVAGESEKLTLAAVPLDLLEAAQTINSKWGDAPAYSAIEISPDRTELVLWWHSESAVPDEVFAVGADVRVETTPLLPGALRDAASKLINGGVLSAVWVPKEGDAVYATPRDSGAASRSSDSLQNTLESEAGVPVVLTSDVAPSPAARQNDTVVAGGARVRAWSGTALLGGCTTGFGVSKLDGQTGMMFAAHCGPSGQQWVRYPNNTGSNVYAYGGGGLANGGRTATSDGAVMTTQFSSPYVYTSTWDQPQSFATTINGVSAAVLGMEICYSGSYSGLACGNIVDQASITYSLSTPPTNTDLTNVVGHRTTRAGGPGAGNGDSGGPGYTPVVAPDGTLKRYAVSIISAIPIDSPPICQGVPGVDTERGRKCSPIVYATSAAQIANDLGWAIRVIP